MINSDKDGFITNIPMTFKKRSGKAIIVLPNGERAIARREAIIDNSMIKVLARAYRWQRMLLDGTHASIDDLSRAEKTQLLMSAECFAWHTCHRRSSKPSWTESTQRI